MPPSITKTWQIDNLEQLETMVKWLNDLLIPQTLILLKGDLGTGKTTLTKKLLALHGFPENKVKSPTFSLINLYPTKNFHFAHLDLYRLEQHDPFLLEEIKELATHKQSIILIEWPEKIDLPETIPGVQQIIEINLAFTTKNFRKISLYVRNLLNNTENQSQ
jgi:tRNA threonylcarbamoyl adenosine modification protein YjeE